MFNLLPRTIIISRAITLVLFLLVTATCLACAKETQIERAGRSGNYEERRERASDAKAPFGLANDIPTVKIASTPDAFRQASVTEPTPKRPFGLATERSTASIKLPPTAVPSVAEMADVGHSLDNSPLALVPDNATDVGTIDMNSPFLPSLIALYDGEVPEAELAFRLKVFEELFDIDTITFASLDNGDLFIIPGTFDGLGYALESKGYTRQTYLGFELWQGRGAPIGESVAIVNNHTISGSPEVVRDVLDRVASGLGLMSQDRDSGIMRIMNRIDNEMFVFASVEDCDVDNCEAAGVSISMDDDNSTVDMKYVMLFRNERAAESAEIGAENQPYSDADLLYLDVRRSGEAIIVTAAFESETFWRDFLDAFQEGISAEWFPGTDA